jgi:hypothetical protein
MLMLPTTKVFDCLAACLDCHPKPPLLVER